MHHDLKFMNWPQDHSNKKCILRKLNFQADFRSFLRSFENNLMKRKLTNDFFTLISQYITI